MTGFTWLWFAIYLFHGKQHVDYNGVTFGEHFFDFGEFDAAAAHFQLGGDATQGTRANGRSRTGSRAA